MGPNNCYGFLSWSGKKDETHPIPPGPKGPAPNIRHSYQWGCQYNTQSAHDRTESIHTVHKYVGHGNPTEMQTLEQPTKQGGWPIILPIPTLLNHEKVTPDLYGLSHQASKHLDCYPVSTHQIPLGVGGICGSNWPSLEIPRHIVLGLNLFLKRQF